MKANNSNLLVTLYHIFKLTRVYTPAMDLYSKVEDRIIHFFGKGFLVNHI